MIRKAMFGLAVLGLGFGLALIGAVPAAAVDRSPGIVRTSFDANGPVIPLAARCGWRPGNNNDLAGHFAGDGIRLRTGPSTTCAVLGLGYHTQGVRYRCFTFGDDNFFWDYVTDTTTHITGWVREDLITTPPLTTSAC